MPTILGRALRPGEESCSPGRRRRITSVKIDPREGPTMIVWVLKDGDDLLTGLGDRLPMTRVDSYADICEQHVCDYETEEEAATEAAVFNGQGGAWTPFPLEFADASHDDFVE